MLSTKEVLSMDDRDLLNKADPDVKNALGDFIREFNKREWSVRIGKTVNNFDEYVNKDYKFETHHGYGFVVDNKPVPYFHPNRSFHDEIIWLNGKLYYDQSVSFGDKLVNSAIVKFYGPSRTLDIITGEAEDLKYLIKTGSPYINFNRLQKDEEYAYTLMSNIELAYSDRKQIWGTTELRTSLQTAARNYARKVPSVIDKRGVKNPINNKIVVDKNSHSIERPMRPSDMIHWISHMSFDHLDDKGNPRKGLIGYYKTKPTMEESFNFLTEVRGIGNYYGYHFSSNLARMPGIGAPQLIMAEHGSKFDTLNIEHGNLDENADYVVAGPGACSTLKILWPDMPINTKTTMKMIIAIRDHQEDFFGIKDELSLRHLNEASELGRFTTFGAEISCCQFSVFTRLKDNKSMALNRANAPISKEVGKDSSFSLEEYL